MLLKVVGELDHGGDGRAQARLGGLSHPRRLRPPGERPRDRRRRPPSRPTPSAPPFFDGVVMLDDRRLLRRVTLSLAGRLPTDAELAAVAKDGLKAMPAILDAVMKEDAFYDRLREGFNDIFLTLGVDGNADQTVLSYEHFEKTRHWYQKYDLSHIKDENERQQAGYKLAADYRKALLGEPMKLIEHIVRNDRPFTEIVTADYIMVSPYTARGYGIFDEVKDKFKNPDDPFEYIPVKLKALVGRSKPENQDSATGFYPHAGLLSTFQYLTRYPTTETNRNRLRARMYYQHFLGVDVLELAARVSDAAAVTAKYKVPTMQASECVVCHKTLDPVAGLFQDYWRFADQGVYGQRKGGWFTDMFGAGFEGEDLPADGALAVPAVARRAHGEGPALRRRDGRARLLHPHRPQGAAAAEGPRRPALPREAAGLLRSSAARPRRSRPASPRPASTSRACSRTGSLPTSTAPTAWRPRSRTRAGGRNWTTSGWCGCSRPSRSSARSAAVFGEQWGKLTRPAGDALRRHRLEGSDRAGRRPERRDGRDPAHPVERRGVQARRPRLRPPGRGAAALPRHRAGRAARRLGRGRRDDPPGHRPPARADPGPLRRRRTRPKSSGRSSCSPASSQDAARAEGHRQAGELLLPPATGRSQPRADDPHYTIRAWRGVVTYLLRRPEFLYE